MTRLHTPVCELFEIDVPANPRKRVMGPSTAVRNAVQLASGPIDAPGLRRPMPPGREHRPHHEEHDPRDPPAHLTLPLFPPPPTQRNPIAAAMPTAAAVPLPHPMLPAHSVAAAGRPTVALNLAQQQSAAAAEAAFDPNEQPAWARVTVMPGGRPVPRAGADEQTNRPGPGGVAQPANERAKRAVEGEGEGGAGSGAPTSGTAFAV